nr:hypothetical protein [Brevibacillus sp. HB1.2]
MKLRSFADGVADVEDAVAAVDAVVVVAVVAVALAPVLASVAVHAVALVLAVALAVALASSHALSYLITINDHTPNYAPANSIVLAGALFFTNRNVRQIVLHKMGVTCLVTNRLISQREGEKNGKVESFDAYKSETGYRLYTRCRWKCIFSE